MGGRIGEAALGGSSNLPTRLALLADLPRGGGRFLTAAAVVGALMLNSAALAQHRRLWIPPEPTPFEKLVTALVQAGVCVWVFVLGSVIGSFLNVVAYRLPKGRPLFWPPSSCPACGNRIAIRDNIPVLGWILLKGKCRNCQAPISPRYPIVEAVVGGLFLLLAAVELFTDGANIPFRDYNPDWGLLTTVLFPKPVMVAQFLFHATWLSAVVAVVLIDLDRQPIPAKKILGWMGAIAVVSVALLPDLLPVKFAPPPIERVGAVLGSLAGLAVGLALGLVRERRWGGPVGTALGLTGLFFGQQAVVSALLLGLLLWIVGTITWRIGSREQRFFSPPLSLWVALGAFLHLLIWRLWVSIPQLPGPHTPWWAVAIYFLICIKI